MSRPRVPKIPYDRYSAVNRKWTVRAADEGFQRLATEARMLIVAQRKINALGHAMFDDGDLAKLLATIDRKTGELKPASYDTIYRAKVKLARAGVLVDASGGENCVWVASEYAFFGFGGSTSCPYHLSPKEL